MTALTVPELTTATLDGAGIFDVLMQANKAHLEAEFQKDRIKGAEYATVYLGSLTQVMQTALQFLVAKEKTGLENQLLQKQIDLATVEITKANATVAQIEAQTLLINQQKDNLVDELLTATAQREKLAQETLAVIAQKLHTEAQTLLVNQQKANLLDELDTAAAQRTKLAQETANLVSQKLQIEAQTLLVGQQKTNLVAEALNIPKQGALLDAQTAQAVQQTANLVAQKLHVEAQVALTTQQKDNLVDELLTAAAQRAKLTQETTNLASQKLHVEAQTLLVTQQKTNLIAEALNIPKQGSLIDAQTTQATQQTANLASQKLQIEAQTLLTTQQKANAIIEGTVLTAQECKLRAEFDLTVASTLRTTEETGLVTQKMATERAQVTALGVDADSVIGRQKELYVAQKDGFKRDAEQKAAKLFVDSWSVRRTTDSDNTAADGTNKLNDLTIGKVVQKLMDGVGVV